MRSRLSVCLIGKNEDRYLPGCLETVRDWADEILLIDTGSSDATPDIARRAGARVVPHAWDGSFANARNVGLDRAAGDWVLFVDCDERLDYMTGGRLPRWTTNLPEGEDAFLVRVLTRARGSSLDFYSWAPRLVRKDPLIRYRGRLYEQLFRGDERIVASSAADVTLHHTGYADPDKERMLRRRAVSMDAVENGTLPPDPPSCLRLANQFAAIDEFDRAEGLYRVLLAEKAIGEIRPLVHWNLALNAARSGDLVSAMDQLDGAAAEFPAMMGTHMVRAKILMQSGRYEEAETPLNLLVESSDHPTDYPDVSVSLPLLLTLKAACRLATDDLEGALVLVEEALARDQSLFEPHEQKAALMERMGFPGEALSACLRAAALRPDLGSIRIRAGRLLLELEKREDALAFLHEAVRLDPLAGPEAREILAALEGVRGEPVVEAVVEEAVETAVEEATEDVVEEAVLEEPDVMAPEAEAAVLTAEPVSMETTIEDLLAAPAATEVPVAGPVVLEPSIEGAIADEVRALESAGETTATPAIETIVVLPEDPIEVTRVAEAAAEAPPARLAKVTVCAIADTLDEARDAFEAGALFAGEILVGLRGQEPGEAVTTGLRGRLIAFPNTGDESEIRNALVGAATGEWILLLEGGESLPEGSVEDVAALCESVAADAWKLRLPDSGRDELLRPFEDNCRLFRKPDGALFEGTPFPRIEPGLSGLGWRILDAPVRIENDPARGEGAVARRRHTLHRVEEALAKKPGDHRLQYQLGLLCLYLEDFESAEPVLRASIRPTGAGLPKDEQAAALSRLSDLAMNRNDLLQAVRDARAALALVPELVRPRYVLATAAYRQQHFAEASAEYRRILNAPGGADSAGLDRAEVSRELGVCLYRAEKFDEAAEAFAFVVAARSADALSRLFLGNALAHLGRFESAYHAFEEAIAIDPELTDARGNLEVMALELGYRLFDTGRASEALALVPEWTRHTELLFLKAIALHALKDLAGARRSLEFLNGLDDNFAEAHWNLALVCRELGDVAAARAALLRFRQLAPGDTRARALEEALSG